LPFGPIFDPVPDEALVEIVLTSLNIIDDSSWAFVRFLVHQCDVSDYNLPHHPVPVPADWFIQQIPASIFMNIPNDASPICPFEINTEKTQASGSCDLGHVGIGRDLAIRWRTNGRPIATTKHFIEQCRRQVPLHLISFLLDAVEALHSGSNSRSTRKTIATFCELMAHHIEETLSRENESMSES
jgi:hypothetical protein